MLRLLDADILCTRIFDVADTIDLEGCKQLISGGGSGTRRLSLRRQGSKYIQLPDPPLLIEVGTRTLAQEEQLAFDLLASLDASQRAAAIIADKAPADYRGPGQPEPPRGAPEGIQASKLTDAQREKLQALLAAYCKNLVPELAAARLAEIEAAGAERVHFAWLGATKPGVGHAYRVQGPTFLLELVNIQSDPAGNPANHIHSVWRSLSHDFGVTTVAK